MALVVLTLKDWCGRTKRKNIYVISTLKRPVPLEHYLYADSKIHKVVDSSKRFQTLGYKQAQESLSKTKKDAPAKTGGRGGGATARGRGGNRSQNKGGGKPIQQPSKSAPKSFGSTDRNLYVHMVGYMLPCLTLQNAPEEEPTPVHHIHLFKTSMRGIRGYSHQY